LKRVPGTAIEGASDIGSFLWEVSIAA